MERILRCMALVAVAGASTAAAVDPVNTFSAGTVIESVKVNQNFGALRSAILSLEAAPNRLPAGCGYGQVPIFDPFGVPGGQWICATTVRVTGSWGGSAPGTVEVGNTDPGGKAVVGQVGTGWGFNVGAAGVWGDADSGTGVWGTSASGNGVYARSISGTALVAYAEAGTSPIAGDFLGNLRVRSNGTAGGQVTAVSLSVSGTKNFRIDHPLDPARRWLVHTAVEAPEARNVYDGLVTADARGEAEVRLPAYFEALNKDFRYQLTAVGAAAPALHVAQEVKGNRFRIAGGRPGMKVSWQVTGLRNDRYMREHPLATEQLKEPGEALTTR